MTLNKKKILSGLKRQKRTPVTYIISIFLVVMSLIAGMKGRYALSFFLAFLAVGNIAFPNALFQTFNLIVLGANAVAYPLYHTLRLTLKLEK